MNLFIEQFTDKIIEKLQNMERIIYVGYGTDDNGEDCDCVVYPTLQKCLDAIAIDYGFEEYTSENIESDNNCDTDSYYGKFDKIMIQAKDSFNKKGFFEPSGTNNGYDWRYEKRILYAE